MNRALLALAGLALSAGCFSLDPVPGQTPCGPMRECPGDFECRSDDHCYPAGGTLCEAASCDTNATCDDTSGSPVCTCIAGYEGSGTTCTDVDECAGGACDANATCTNTPGSFTCACNAGFEGDGTTCTDIDECATGALTCGANASCVNDPGTAHCECDPGFAGDPDAGCTDIDECLAAICSPLAFCTNTVGSFDCVCRGGYLDENGDGSSCVKSGDGHVVLLGHDFFEHSIDLDRLLGNAVLLANTTGTVEVLGFTQFADTTPTGEVVNADAGIQARAAERSRTVNITHLADATQLLAALAGKQVLVLYEQELGPPDLAPDWAPILHEFVDAGGVVIVMSYFDDTWRIAARTNILSCGAATSFASGQPINVVSPGDPVALDVTPTYLGSEGSAARPCNDGAIVTADGTGNAVVIHKTHTRPITGHAVLIGHDLFERGAGVDRIVGNSVINLANTSGDVSVLAYTQFADLSVAGEVENTNGAITQRAAELGRFVNITPVADSSQVGAQLEGKNVFLVYEQELNNGPALATIGAALQPALLDFVRRGGVIVVMEHNGGSGGTFEVARGAGLFEVTGVNGIFGVSVEVVDAGDPIASEVTSPYPATNGSVTFNTTDLLATTVVRDPLTTLPAVLHRTSWP